MKDKTRLEYLDAAKGLGILLVILGHIYASVSYTHLTLPTT